MAGESNSGDLRFLRRTLIVLGLVILALFFWQILDVLLLAFGAVLVAILLRAFADLIAGHTPLSDKWALAAAMTLVAIAVLGAAALFGAEVRAQISALGEALPHAWESFQQRVGGEGWGQGLLERIFGESGGTSLVSRLGGVAMTVLGAAADFLLVVFGGVYFALQPGLYKRGLAALAPRSLQGEARDTIEVCGSALRLWLLGQLISMTLVGCLTTAGLWLIGMPSALALGLLAGFAEFVPIVGPIMAAVPALLLAFSQGTTMVLWTLGVYLVVQQVESNMIMPLVERRMVSLPPALLLFAVVTTAILFGPLGVLFATPLTVVAFVLIKKLYVRETLGKDTSVPGEQESGT